MTQRRYCTGCGKMVRLRRIGKELTLVYGKHKLIRSEEYCDNSLKAVQEEK